VVAQVMKRRKLKQSETNHSDEWRHTLVKKGKLADRKRERHLTAGGGSRVIRLRVKVAHHMNPNKMHRNQNIIEICKQVALESTKNYNHLQMHKHITANAQSKSRTPLMLRRFDEKTTKIRYK
jgi:translation initiation factor 2B subunit (eIF-2B alpha/beta/delta family)